MRSHLCLPLLLFATIILASCGGETVEEKVNRTLGEAVNSAIENASGSEVNTEQMQEALKEMGQNMDSLDLGKLGDVEVINFRDLKPLMPERLAGLSRTQHLGETNGVMGLEISEATATYGSGDKMVEAKLMDTGGAGVLLLSMAAFANMKIDKETAQGSERTYTLDGYPAYEKYSNKNGSLSSSLTVLVNKRFVVSLEGKGIDAKALADGFREFRVSSLPTREAK